MACRMGRSIGSKNKMLSVSDRWITVCVSLVLLYNLPVAVSEVQETHKTAEPRAFHIRNLGTQEPPEGCLHVNTTTHHIVDSLGREKNFHGVNVVVKGPPWLPRMDAFDPRWSFVEEDMQALQEMGLNAIRLGMMWPGAEPQKGVYNETYFTAAKTLVNNAGKYGIYTLLDMHQDALSDKFCGEGVPDWAVDIGTAWAFPWPVEEPFVVDPKTGYPTKEQCGRNGWPRYQTSESTCAAYQSIYNNTNGLLDSLAAFWGKVAQEFSDNPYILGYEIINEPWAGDIYADFELLLPTIADKKNLAPAYEVVNAEIRKYDQCHSVYFESVTWDWANVGFEHVPGGLEYANRSVLSYHFYTPPMITPNISFPERQKDLERLHCAGFLTEFGICSVNDKVIAVMDEADKYIQSWLGWSYKPFLVKTGECGSVWYDNGTMIMAQVDMLSRTYATVVAGVTTKMDYSHTTKQFTLAYHTTAACTAKTTEVYLNKALHYKNGYKVSISPSQAATWSSPQTNWVYIIHNSSLPEGTTIQVTIVPT